MSNNNNTVWKSNITQQLAAALTTLDSIDNMQNFLRDVMTEKEIIEISSRLEAARMLTNGESYLAVTNKTKLSSRTVARISDWLKNGCNGYQTALQSVDLHHNHIPPASAE